MSSNGVLIVGAGHAGVQLAASLREEGFDDAITILSAEVESPYQRPPLSKAFLKGNDAASLPLRGEQFYKDHRIDLRLGEHSTRIDRGARTVTGSSGNSFEYGHLVLATGARSRPFTAPGAALEGVLELRTLADGRRLRERLGKANRIVVVGAGFIGLEIAATAIGFGAVVTIVEIAPRAMGRAVSPILSQFYLEAHLAFGATFMLGASAVALHGRNGAVVAVELSDGAQLPCDVVVVGIGILADDRLASDAGLVCDDGIVVNDVLETSDAAISAIGDCARFPCVTVGFSLRLESVQNAVDQARCVSRRIVGRPTRYDALPWFWSDQRDLKLQIAGLSHGCDQWMVRGDPKSRSFSAFGYRDGRLAVVESVNRPADHMAARRVLTAGESPSPEQLSSVDFDFRIFAAHLKQR